jgi:hypothetical protein
MPQTYQNALRDPQMPPDAKMIVQHNVFHALFVQSVAAPPKHKK